MPKVTLLRDPWADYMVAHGKHRIQLRGGEPRDVPAAIANVLRKRLDESGRPLFRIEEAPAPAPVADLNAPSKVAVADLIPDVPQPTVESLAAVQTQNVRGALRQMGLKDVAL